MVKFIVKKKFDHKSHTVYSNCIILSTNLLKKQKVNYVKKLFQKLLSVLIWKLAFMFSPWHVSLNSLRSNLFLISWTSFSSFLSSSVWNMCKSEEFSVRVLQLKEDIFILFYAFRYAFSSLELKFKLIICTFLK